MVVEWRRSGDLSSSHFDDRELKLLAVSGGQLAPALRDPILVGAVGVPMNDAELIGQVQSVDRATVLRLQVKHRLSRQARQSGAGQNASSNAP